MRFRETSSSIFTPPFIASSELIERRRLPREPDADHGMREQCVPLKADERVGERFQNRPKRFRSEPPVVVRMIVDGKIHRRADDHNAARLENPVQLFERLARLLHMLECVEAEDGAYRFGREVDGVQIENLVHADPFPHVTPDILPAWEERPEVGEVDLIRHLKRSELVNRASKRQPLVHDNCEVSNVLSHCAIVLQTTLSIKKRGRRFVSRYILATYSPTTPRLSSWSPPRK